MGPHKKRFYFSGRTLFINQQLILSYSSWVLDMTLKCNLASGCSLGVLGFGETRILFSYFPKWWPMTGL